MIAIIIYDLGGGGEWTQQMLVTFAHTMCVILFFIFLKEKSCWETHKGKSVEQREERNTFSTIFCFCVFGCETGCANRYTKKIKKLNDIWKDIRVSEGEKKECETPIRREEKI